MKFWAKQEKKKKCQLFIFVSQFGDEVWLENKPASKLLMGTKVPGWGSDMRDMLVNNKCVRKLRGSVLSVHARPYLNLQVKSLIGITHGTFWMVS